MIPPCWLKLIEATMPTVLETGSETRKHPMPIFLACSSFARIPTILSGKCPLGGANLRPWPSNHLKTTMSNIYIYICIKKNTYNMQQCIIYYKTYIIYYYIICHNRSWLPLRTGAASSTVSNGHRLWTVTVIWMLDPFIDTVATYIYN